MMRMNRTNVVHTDFKNTTQSALNGEERYNSFSSWAWRFPTCDTNWIVDYGSHVYRYIGSAFSSPDKIRIESYVYVSAVWAYTNYLRLCIADSSYYNGSNYHFPFEIVLPEDWWVYMWTAWGSSVTWTGTVLSVWFHEIILEIDFSTKVATLSSPSFTTVTLQLSDSELNNIKWCWYIQICPWDRIEYSEINATVD